MVTIPSNLKQDMKYVKYLIQENMSSQSYLYTANICIITEYNKSQNFPLNFLMGGGFSLTNHYSKRKKKIQKSIVGLGVVSSVNKKRNKILLPR